ncbi:MAG: GAF domain-containing protein, partial [Desulfobacteraceae bacterium]|jgi:putative methionine-R-sulfoxide reductase with GAF domain
MLGVDSLSGTHLRDFFDEENLALVMNNLKHRIEEESANEYRVNINIKKDRKKPIQILAIPEIDHYGKFINSLGLIRDLSVPHISKTIHSHIASLDGTDILESVACDLQQIIPFDYLSVGLYSDDRKSIRPFYSYPPDEGELQIRWWDIPEIAVEMMNDTTAHKIDDINDFLKDQRWKKVIERPETQEFFSRGYHSCLRYPVIEDNLPIASVSLYSKTVGYYTEDDILFIDSIPMQHAVIKALRYETKRESTFRFELMKDISMVNCDDWKSIAQVICDDIQKHYKWDNVAFFVIDEDSEEFRLLSQAAANDNVRAPEDFRQPINKGILAKACTIDEAVNIPDLSISREYGTSHIPLFNNSQSEFCISIPVEGGGTYLLNIEDTRKNAISEQEQELLCTAAKEICSALARGQLEKNAQRLAILRDLHYEVAMQTKTPLSIAFSTLFRLQNYASGEISGAVKKVLRHLKKVDLTYDRLMMFEQNLEREKNVFPYNESLLDIPKVIRELITDLPLIETNIIEVKIYEQETTKMTWVRGDLFQISFCIESILSYFLRMATEEDKIKIFVQADNDNVIIQIRGLAPKISSDANQDYHNTKLAGKTLVDLALGFDIIEKFIKNAEGQMFEQKRVGNELEIKFSIPAVQGVS